MVCPMPWNPINFIDGESHWIFWEMIYIAIAILLSKGLSLLLNRFSRTISSSSFRIFSVAVYTPAICLIWYLTALYSIDLVTDGFVSQARSRAWGVLISGGTILSLGWFLIRLKNLLIEHAIALRTEEGRKSETHSMQAISNLLTAIIGIIVLVLLNDCTGMNLTTLLAFGGVGGLALAFASQEIVSNFFGGFMVHMTRPFLIGEVLALPSLNTEGVVEEIGWYQTRIRPSSKEAVYIPNSLFSKALLVNKSRITRRLFNETVWLDVSPLSTIEKILCDIDSYLASHPRFDRTEQPGSRIDSLGPSSAITIVGLTEATSLHDFYRLRGEALLHIAGIVLSHGGTITHSPALAGSSPPAGKKS